MKKSNVMLFLCLERCGENQIFMTMELIQENKYDDYMTFIGLFVCFFLNEERMIFYDFENHVFMCFTMHKNEYFHILVSGPIHMISYKTSRYVAIFPLYCW